MPERRPFYHAALGEDGIPPAFDAIGTIASTGLAALKNPVPPSATPLTYVV